MGAEGFAERARVELLATGETVRKRTVETRDELTAQEAQIARLARDGRTNPEIGAQLYISPRTVEWHLRNVFTKLGIRSRRELHDALPDEPSAIASPRGRCPWGRPGGHAPGVPDPWAGGTRGRPAGGTRHRCRVPRFHPKGAPLMPPTIVLVHGAFAESASWDRVIRELEDAGHDVIAAANPLRGLAADAQSVTDLVSTVDGPVVLVGHSYGGMVISNVDANAGEITGLVYVAAFAPEHRRERQRARAALPRQHARRRAAAGAAKQRHDRPVHRARDLP